MTTPVTVSELYVYPLKSARAVAVRQAPLRETGLAWDRQWMLVDPNGLFMSQRTHPQLALIVPAVADVGLELSAPGLPTLSVPYITSGERLEVRVHADWCFGIDQGEIAADWATTAVGKPARLVRVPPHTERMASPKFAGSIPAPMGFADGYPLLVCNEASLADLNPRLPQPVPMERFRPNVVLAGLPPWEEDRIDSLTIGAATLRLVKPCTRCTIPSRDQRTGELSTDPTPVLRQFRFSKALLGVTFGENAVIVNGVGASIARGAQCQVHYDPAAAALA